MKALDNDIVLRVRLKITSCVTFQGEILPYPIGNEFVAYFSGVERSLGRIVWLESESKCNENVLSSRVSQLGQR